MFENLKKWLINKLGGYHYTEWRRMCDEEDKKHEAALAEKDRTIMELANLSAGTPEDCKRGTWCSECVFAVRKLVNTGQFPYYESYTTYYCGKSEACQHLLRKGGSDA